MNKFIEMLKRNKSQKVGQVVLKSEPVEEAPKPKRTRKKKRDDN